MVCVSQTRNEPENNEIQAAHYGRGPDPLQKFSTCETFFWHFSKV